jgi:hypothetical protein
MVGHRSAEQGALDPAAMAPVEVDLMPEVAPTPSRIPTPELPADRPAVRRRRNRVPPARDEHPSAEQTTTPSAPDRKLAAPPAATSPSREDWHVGLPPLSAGVQPQQGPSGLGVFSNPQGSAGDPLLGRVTVVPTERYQLVPSGNGRYRYDDPLRFKAQIARDGAVTLEDRHAAVVGPMVLFDLTDELMRALGQDPYRYEKQRFLEATFERRVQKAEEDRKETLRQALWDLPEYLHTIWFSRARTRAEARRLLFLLWEETAEDAGGAEARAIIEVFIERHLTRGGEEAFRDDELDELNRGAKARRFDPYHTHAAAPARVTP